MKNYYIQFGFILLLLGGCSTLPTPAERYITLSTLAHEQNLSIEILPTGRFNLSSIITNRCENRSMHVYIEGDGLSWITRSKLSDDPTPINPLAAKLMLQDMYGCKAYLARPCQYKNNKECNKKYWSSARFSEDVIKGYDEALNILKKRYNIDSFVLIGYSGGGAVAALETGRRKDVKMFVSVAGNLDTNKWTSLYNITPLSDSLNPADFSSYLKNIDQIHFIGNKDSVVSKEIFQSYKDHFIDSKNIKSFICDECTHNQGWETQWRSFSKLLE